MSNGFIDFKIRVEKKRAGDFFEDLAHAAPYAQCIGYTVAIPSYKALPPPAATKLADKPPLSKQQKQVLTLIESGVSSREDLIQATGMNNVMRVVNNLKHKYRLVKGNAEEGFTLRKDQ